MYGCRVHCDSCRCIQPQQCACTRHTAQLHASFFAHKSTLPNAFSWAHTKCIFQTLNKRFTYGQMQWDRLPVDGCVLFAMPACRQWPTTFWYWMDDDVAIVICFLREIDKHALNYTRSKTVCRFDIGRTCTISIGPKCTVWKSGNGDGICTRYPICLDNDAHAKSAKAD